LRESAEVRRLKNGARGCSKGEKDRRAALGFQDLRIEAHDEDGESGNGRPWTGLFTSGHTGKPKGGVITQRAVPRFWQAFNQLAILRGSRNRAATLRALTLVHGRRPQRSLQPDLYSAARVEREFLQDRPFIVRARLRSGRESPAALCRNQANGVPHHMTLVAFF